MIDFYILLFIISFIIQCKVGKRMHGYFLNPIFLFNIVFFLHNWSFSFSQIFDDTIEWTAPSSVSQKTQSIVLFINLTCLWAFFFAYKMSFKKSSLNLINTKVFYNYSFYYVLYIVFTFLHIVRGLFTGAFFKIYGEHQALTSIEAFNPIDIIIFSRTIFGAVVLINQRKINRRFWLIIVLELMISTLTGGRKTLVIILISALISQYEYIRIDIKKVFKFLVVILPLSYVVSFVSIYRAYSDTNLGFKEKFFYSNDLIMENGMNLLLIPLRSTNSEGVQNWTYQLIDSGGLNQLYGLSYVQSFINTFLLRPFQGDLVNYQAAFYFKSIAYPEVENHGWDFSFIAESILNWGYFAFIPSFLFGIIVARIYYLRTKSNYYDILYVLIFALLYIHMRTDSTSFFRSLSFFVFSFYFLRKLKIVKRFKLIKINM